MGQFTWECQRITTFLPAIMAVESTKLSGACSLEKEGEILSKLDGCPGVKQCYGEDVTLGEEEETVYNLLLNLLMMLLELILLKKAEAVGYLNL